MNPELAGRANSAPVSVDQDGVGGATEPPSVPAADSRPVGAGGPLTRRPLALDLGNVLQVDDTELNVLMSTGC